MFLKPIQSAACATVVFSVPYGLHILGAHPSLDLLTLIYLQHIQRHARKQKDHVTYETDDPPPTGVDTYPAPHVPFPRSRLRGDESYDWCGEAGEALLLSLMAPAHKACSLPREHAFLPAGQTMSLDYCVLFNPGT